MKVKTEAFEIVHNKKPGGYGCWIFAVHRKDFTEGWWFQTTGLYSEAKKRAIKYAKEKGITEFYVMG